MASTVDILLRLIGDSRSAERSMENVGRAADQTNTKVGRLQQSFGSLASTAGVAGAAVGAGMIAIDQITSRIDRALGLGRDPNVGGAVSASDTAARIARAGRLTTEEAMENEIFGVAGGVAGLLGVDLPFGLGGRNKSRDKRQAAISALAASNPAQLQASLAYLSDRDRAFAETSLQGRTASAAYQGQLKGQTVVNVNTVTAHLNDGESLRALVRRAERNNGNTTRFRG